MKETSANPIDPALASDPPVSGCGMRWACLAAFVAAIVMGAPSLRGTFLAGDDIQLVRDHVLVNQPSFAHAVRLLDPATNRDLYQPVAMVSFQLNFAVVRALGLTPGEPGEVPGAWVFHLTNVLLHGLCAVLVCLLARRLTGSVTTAGVAAVLFALHPLNVEVIAWINGRMMLLSTLFLLSAVLMFERFRERGGYWRAGLVLLCVLLCHMSKVRVALPLLMFAPLVLQRVKPKRSWWIVWGLVAGVTVWLIGVNYAMSQSMMAGGAGQLTGSRIVRTLLALGWYVSRIFAPICLSPYHPAGAHVDWSHPPLLWAALIVAAAAVAVIASIKRTRLGWVGALWFVLTLAATLPLVTTRNLAFADRYAYLPLVGALLPVSALLVLLARKLPSAGNLVVAVCVSCGLLATSWRTVGYYHDDVAYSQRIVDVYPNDPGLWVKHAWALYRANKLDAAIAAVDAIRNSDDHAAAGDAYQVIGEAKSRQGDDAGALAAFRNAVALDPESGLAHKRLGVALAHAGDFAAALHELEQAAKLSPKNNPTLHELARLYRAHGDDEAARRVYEQILTNNPYDADAAASLAAVDIVAQDYASARKRLASVLVQQPAAVRIRALYAWVSFLAGDVEDADQQVQAVLVRAPADALVRCVYVGVALAKASPQSAISQTASLLNAHKLDDAPTFNAFAAIIQAHADRNPQDPWPYYVMCQVCAATNQTNAAQLAADAFKNRTQDPALHQRIDDLLNTGRNDNP